MALTDETARELEALIRVACKRLRYLGVDTDEIVQRALLKAHTTKTKIGHLGAWARCAAYSAAIDVLREEGARRPRSPKVLCDSRLVASHPCYWNGHESPQELGHYLNLLRAAMGEREFTAVAMLIDGRSGRDVAIFFRVPRKQVAQWLEEAMRIVLRTE